MVETTPRAWISTSAMPKWAQVSPRSNTRLKAPRRSSIAQHLLVHNNHVSHRDFLVFWRLRAGAFFLFSWRQSPTTMRIRKPFAGTSLSLPTARHQSKAAKPPRRSEQ